MADVLIRVDGVDMPNPSKLNWSLQDVSIGDSGRDDTGYMYKGRITQKRKLELEWSAVTPSVASTILNAFNPEYVNVRYLIPRKMLGRLKTFTLAIEKATSRFGRLRANSTKQSVLTSSRGNYHD